LNSAVLRKTRPDGRCWTDSSDSEVLLWLKVLCIITELAVFREAAVQPGWQHWNGPSSSRGSIGFTFSFLRRVSENCFAGDFFGELLIFVTISVS